MRRLVTIALLISAVSACVRTDGPAGSFRPPKTAFVRGMPPEGIVGKTRRSLETRLYNPPLSPIHRTHPSVGRMRGKGSLSIGTTKDGFVVECRRLPIIGAHHRILEAQAVRNTRCGTDEVVAALLKAAEDVAGAHEGAVLTVGNLSREGGGDIPWSVSHNSGRDVDIGLYLKGPDGRQVIPPDFVHVDAAGRGEIDGVEVAIDVDSTWLAIRSLLTNRRIEIQWLFIADPLRALLLDH
ncbi:MAG: hypothetical protein GXP54_10140, partial [Deltaproteobacteria bacterium]|nr:hypothetical protein [Deltaproteobacteria bacterium]